MRLRVLIAVLVFGVAASAETGAELFQKAVTQERAAGNLEEAIKLYQRVVKEFASDRPLAAKALVQAARCYEKLGQDKAVRIYEQITRDYSDQREFATTASARLAVLRQGDHAADLAAMTQRKIEAPGLSNGRRAIDVDRTAGTLTSRDLTGRDKLVFFKTKMGALSGIEPSRDFSTVFLLLTSPDGSHTTAVINLDGTGYREIGAYSIAPTCVPDWSWDNRYIFVCENQPDGTRQLLRISAADGKIRKLWETPNQVHCVSADGRFLAVSAARTDFSKVSVMPIQGGDPRVVAEHARILDWTLDGRYLAVAMERSGTEALYLIPIKDGRLAGDPVFVRYGSFYYGRTTANGGLFYGTAPPEGGYAVWLGDRDADGRVAGWKRLRLSGSSLINLSVRWSPDSSQILYVAADQAAGQNTPVVRLHNIASGEERELYRGAKIACLWAMQHPNLFCRQITPQNTTELLSISTDSGRVEQLGSVPGAWIPLFGSQDDRTLYMLAAADRSGNRELVRWDISTQPPARLDSVVTDNIRAPLPDERWLARRNRDTLEIRPTSGGDWKTISSIGRTEQIAFTPDGNWLVYHAVDAAGKECLFRVATAGGQPERVGDFPSPSPNGLMWISPDGKKVIADSTTGLEMWLLENFEPKVQAAR